MNAQRHASVSDRTLKDVITLYVLTGIGVIPLVMSPLGYPLQIFCTLTHEVGHAFMTGLTGGSLHRIHVDANTSGYIIPKGGIPGLIAPAGYISTSISGVMLFWFCSSEDRTRTGMKFLCLVLGLYAFAVSPQLGVILSLGGILAAILIMLFLNLDGIAVAGMRALAMITCIESVWDLCYLLTDCHGRRKLPLWSEPVPKPAPGSFYSDATLMAWNYGGSEGMWVVTWLTIQATVLIAGIYFSARAEIRGGNVKILSISPALRTFKKGEGEYTLK